MFFSSSLASQLTVIRILRVGRLFRLLRKSKSLYIIFNAFLRTIPAFGNVGSLILVMIFIFSTIGNKIFANVQLNGALTNHNNFQSFGSSFLTLIIMMTGENWYDILNGV